MGFERSNPRAGSFSREVLSLTPVGLSVRGAWFSLLCAQKKHFASKEGADADGAMVRQRQRRLHCVNECSRIWLDEPYSIRLKSHQSNRFWMQCLLCTVQYNLIGISPYISYFQSPIGI